MKKLIAVFLFLSAFFTFGQTNYETLPFSTDQKHITVWNGEAYVPLFIKGVNLGISVPGTFPGELAARKSDYARWLTMIQEAGFNTIRLYTLHYPHFYHVLDSFNNANKNKPIYFFQGIWMEEEIPNYDEDLYSLTASFQEEMTGNIGAVHGDITIAPRPGKASGTYMADVSEYMIAYIIGREIHPPEVAHTNSIHNSDVSFTGNHLSIFNAQPAEVWMTARLDEVLTHEETEYGMMHPISFSSWPSLDPLNHPEEPNTYEDSETIDLKNLNIANAPGGYFASYHAYPYYPDFISRQNSYQNETDYLGQNSYLAYIKDLKSHYSNFPLLIAEFGTSSSWGIAHYAQSGIHHGGASEIDQGEAYLRMFWNIEQAELAGGIQFAWIDEWFKRTWITDPYDYNPDRRVLWQNIGSAEQNFGLVGYRKKDQILSSWEAVCTPCEIESLEAGADYSFFRMKLNLSQEFNIQDTLWVGIDTYDENLGESILPNGKSVAHRAEFALMITQDQAVLYVTEAYDTYGIWHGTSGPNQKYRSIVTDGAPWRIVRWKNNNTQNEIQFVGRLGVNRLNMPAQSNDAVIIDESSIEIRLPWTYLQFVDPSEKKALNDDRTTSPKEEAISSGIAMDFFYGDQSYSTNTRYSWENWQYPSALEEYKKKSYDIIQQGLESIPSSPIAHADQYLLSFEPSVVSKANGVLANDVSFGLSTAEAYLHESPENGLLQLNADGSFSYQPVAGFHGTDRFEYHLRTGPNWSEPVGVSLEIETPLNAEEVVSNMVIYPNPGSDFVKINSKQRIQRIEIFDSAGNLVINTFGGRESIDVKKLTCGIYFIRVTTEGQQEVQKFVKG